MREEDLSSEIERLRRQVADLQDIQARLVRTEQALRDSEDRFRSLLGDSYLAYQSLDQSGCYIDCNKQLCRLIGYSREELLGRRFDEYWESGSKHLFRTTFGGFKKSGAVQTELQLVHEGRFISRDIGFRGNSI